jgi:hypothetical protein
MIENDRVHRERAREEEEKQHQVVVKRMTSK